MADEERTVETAETEETPETPKKSRKKLEKDLTEHPLVKITAMGGNQGQVVYDFTDLPEDIQAKLGPFGLGHKLGDAAAGKRDVEAEEAIARVWQGLMDGDWSVRAPAAPKVSLKAIVDNYEMLTEGEKDTAKALLTSLGMKIPGITEEVEG
jgi:hypothetical protein